MKETTDHSAGEFFLGPMITALPEGAILTAVKFPVWKEDRVGSGFLEVSARRSDFALVAAAAQVAHDEEGRCTRLAIGIGGAGDTPVRLNSCIDALIGSRLDERAVREAIGAAVEDLETVADLHASAAYRKRVAATLACRAVAQARDDATGGARAH